MNTRILYINKTIYVIILLSFQITINAKIINADNFADAITKYQQMMYKGRHALTPEFLANIRSDLFYHDAYYWQWDISHSDTIYVYDLSNDYAYKYYEYVVISNNIYSIEYNIGTSMKFKRMQYRRGEDLIRDLVTAWDVETFTKWRDTDIHDNTYIYAIRIIRKSKHRFDCSFCSFWDNSDRFICNSLNNREIQGGFK